MMRKDENQQRKNFKTFMQRHNLTAYSWAKKAGVTEGTIRAFCAGRSSSLTYKTLHKLADSIGVSTKEIIDPAFDYEELLDHSTYIVRKDFDSCISNIDDVINKKKLTVSDNDRKRLYFAWYDVKHEYGRISKKYTKADEDKIGAMLKLL